MFVDPEVLIYQKNLTHIFKVVANAIANAWSILRKSRSVYYHFENAGQVLLIMKQLNLVITFQQWMLWFFL